MRILDYEEVQLTVEEIASLLCKSDIGKSLSDGRVVVLKLKEGAYHGKDNDKRKRDNQGQ